MHAVAAENQTERACRRTQSGVDQVVLGGLHVVRGDNMCGPPPHRGRSARLAPAGA